MEKLDLGPQAKKDYVKPTLSKNEPLVDVTFATAGAGTTTGGGGGTTTGGTTTGGGGTTTGGTTTGGTTTGTTIPGTGGAPGTVI